MKDFIRNARIKIAAAGTAATAALATSPAFAGEYAEAVKAGVDNAELLAIGVVVVTIGGVLLFIRSGKQATRS
ncbi:hypothetical protein [Stenotrophomonas sp.]|uniref:hypothetical protein n=1 Tax=Stenotrophomonas sp. TaxID=69392 RepID=UPI0031D31093